MCKSCQHVFRSKRKAELSSLSDKVTKRVSVKRPLKEQCAEGLHCTSVPSSLMTVARRAGKSLIAIYSLIAGEFPNSRSGIMIDGDCSCKLWLLYALVRLTAA